jgi:trehalose 6-phosphate phosphatase
MHSSGVPEIEADWALFLDLDGTLIDFAATPDAVVVQQGLPDLLSALSHDLGGALSVVTGRARETADRLLAPWRPPGGFSHGAELRDAAGHILEDHALPAVPADWTSLLAARAAAWPGVILERKPHGVALHYRGAPERRDDAHAALAGLLADHAAAFDLLPAHMAFEIRPRGANKARAVDVLMRAPPFMGRRPVFVGDDVTDEDGMRAARALGGFGLHVGRDFLGGPAEVRDWIARGHARLLEGTAHART